MGSLCEESRLTSSYRIDSCFPPTARGSAKAHCDDADKMRHRVTHLGLKHSSLSVLLLYTRDPYNIMVGGEFNMALAKNAMLMTGPTIHVSAKNPLMVVSHSSKFYHMASASAAVREVGVGEPDIVETLLPGRRTRAEHEGNSPKVVAIRGSVVLHTSEVPIVSALLAREREQEVGVGNLAAALTAKQKRWRVELGIGPLNANERSRSSLAALRWRVRDFPINGEEDKITKESMAPYFAQAHARRAEFYNLGLDLDPCDGAEELELHEGMDPEAGGGEGDDPGDEPADEDEASRPTPARKRRAPKQYSTMVS